MGTIIGWVEQIITRKARRAYARRILAAVEAHAVLDFERRVA